MSRAGSGSEAEELGGGAGGLLRGNPAFRALWGARFVSVAGDSLGLVALMLYVADTTGQALAVSVLLLVGDFAPALLSPVTGALSDRLDLKRLMVACELVQAAIVAIIALTLPPLPVLLLLVAARAIAGQVFLPASRAAVPALVRGRDLEAANSAIGFGTNGAEVLGPAAAAALFGFAGIRGVLLADAASFLVSALLLASVPSLPRGAREDGPSSLLGDARAGLRYIASVPAVRVVTLAFCAVVAFNGIDDVALVLLAKDTFRVGDGAVGLLLAAVALGLFAGYVLLARYGARAAMPVLLIAGFAVSSLGNLLTGLAWAVGAAIAMQGVRGLGIAAMDVASSTILQRRVPPAMLGRVFGNLYGAIGIAAALSYIGGGLLLDATSAPRTLVIAGIGGTLATLVAAWALPGALRRTPVVADEG
jgi:MFS family permease